MAIYSYKRYKILLHADSKKTQGLQTGDIVRRQYFDGTNVIYSLMCVLEYGRERSRNSETGLYEEKPYFIGALLEGDAPQQNEILDFARITNLFNVDRSGALYLTASDDKAPFMDVIDGIGRKASLSWPENIAVEGFEDSSSQYIVNGIANLNIQYEPSSQDNSRILTVTRMSEKTEGFEGLQQDFYQFVQNPNRVLVSYKIRASKQMEAKATLGYIDDLRIDGEWTEAITDEWKYKFHVITVDYSGRHLRSFKLSMDNLSVGDELQIADFNIILLSSVANFGDSSNMRVGKLDGVVDPVFGQLEGYGAYLQKLYAAHAAHISGTLTAGDENGFGATFYAGKIHRNCFVSSLDVSFTSDIHIDDTLINPTGLGIVYRSGTEIEMVAQSNEWLIAHNCQRYCYSFWAYAKRPCQLGIQQNGKTVGTITIAADQTHEWRRVHVYFDLINPENEGEDLLIKVIPTFSKSVFDQVSSSETNPDESVFYFTAPQLESGEYVTQYQPTDTTLNYTDEYGAWFARGGIGGTMQNPLLQLNYDGQGSIGTRSKSIELKQDGSGHLANKNIKWDEDGKVTFGKDVTLNWENLGSSAQDNMANRYMRIIGEDTFVIIGQETTEGKTYSPTSITLSLEEVGFSSTSSQRQWYYKFGGEWIAIEDGNGPTLTVTPDSPWWNNESSVTFRCVIALNDSRTYTDTFTVKKQYVQGYTVIVTSSKGISFQNGTCETTLTAQVYYQGKLVDRDYAIDNFKFIWKRYDAATMEELECSNGVNDTLTLDYELDGSEIYVCELATADSFDYSFPIIF